MHTERAYCVNMRKRTVAKIVYLNMAEKTSFDAAAALAGITVSSWMRERLLRASAQELKEAVAAEQSAGAICRMNKVIEQPILDGLLEMQHDKTDEANNAKN